MISTAQSASDNVYAGCRRTSAVRLNMAAKKADNAVSSAVRRKAALTAFVSGTAVLSAKLRCSLGRAQLLSPRLTDTSWAVNSAAYWALPSGEMHGFVEREKKNK